MPPEGFLQKFHDLAENDDEFRIRAALSVRSALVGEGGEAASDGAETDLQYALRRLVRGVQSSRQCCRQGFTLTLAELLEEFPGELGSVLQLIRQHTGLQPGLKPGELKERLLGRIFAYQAVLEAGCLQAVGSASTRGKKNTQQGPTVHVGELCTGLHEVYASRQYLRAAAAHLQAQACRDLCAAGQQGSVPEAIKAWGLDEKLDADPSQAQGIDVHLAGLALELQIAYDESVKTGIDQTALKAWPLCVRKNALLQASAMSTIAAALGSELITLSVADKPPHALDSFCRSLVHSAASTKELETLQASVWTAFDNALFPEHASPTTQASGLKFLGELAFCLHEAAAARPGPKAEALLVGLFKHMNRGFKLLFQMLSWQRAHTHHAAIYAQRRLAEAAGAPPQQVQVSRNNKKKRKHSDAVAAAPKEWLLADSTRLSILSALQRHRDFGSMKGAFQRQWQQALVSPMTASGVRARCAALLESLAENSAAPTAEATAGAKPATARIGAEQLLQLATHGSAPDEVILAVLCLLFTASCFQPASGAATSTYSLQSFRDAIGLSVAAGDDDLYIPVLSNEEALPALADAEDDAPRKTENMTKHWRAKFGMAITGLLRRASPETAEKQLIAAGADAEEGNVLKTVAFNGCLSDGSLWVMRLHEWYAHVASKAAQPPGSPRMTPKKKKKTEAASGIKPVVSLSESDLALRARCQELCASILARSESDLAMPARQKNALCGVPLSLALAILQAEDEDERKGLRLSLKDFFDVLEKLKALPAVGEAKEGGKKRAELLKQRAEVLAVVPRIACELFVDAQGLTKEAARAAWRELAEFASDETLASLCSSVCDAEDAMDGDNSDAEEKSDKEGSEEEDEEEDDEEDEEDGEGGDPSKDAARIAKFQQATAALKAKREAEDSDEENSDGDVMLGSDEVMKQLLEGGGAGGGSLLDAFASSGLEGADTDGPKLSKRQKRLRARQDELQRKFRELELLELFVQRHADKRPIAITVLQQLFEAMLGVAVKAAKSGKSAEGEKAAPKADAQLRRVEGDLARRLGDVLSKTLKAVGRAAVVKEVSKWHASEDWGARARALYEVGQGQQAAAAGQKPAEVGGALLYWICAVHRAKAHPGLGHEDAGGWEVAEELLKVALKDWSGKRGNVMWCSAILGVFANRVPQLLLKLPWLDKIRESKNAYIQRAQVTLVATQVLRAPGFANATGATDFAAGFACLCADLLESSLVGDKTASGAAPAAPPAPAPGDAAPGAEGTSQSQRQKLRRDILRAMTTATRAQGKRKPGDAKPAPALTGEPAARVVAVLQTVVKSLPARRGEVYQLCLHLQRSIRGLGGGDAGGGGGKKAKGEVEAAASTPKEGPPAKKRKEGSGGAPTKR